MFGRKLAMRYKLLTLILGGIVCSSTAFADLNGFFHEVHFVDANKNEIGRSYYGCQVGSYYHTGDYSDLYWERIGPCSPSFICEENDAAYKCMDGQLSACTPNSFSSDSGYYGPVCTSASDQRLTNP